MLKMIPEEFIKRIYSQKYIDSEALLKALEESSPISIRINPGKWEKKPSDSDPVPWCNNGYYLEIRPSYTLDPLFHSGCYYPQEASSMCLEQIIRQTSDLFEKLKVLDLCAAPGGKSTHLSDIIGPRNLLVANEPGSRVVTDYYQKSGLLPYLEKLRFNVVGYGCTTCIGNSGPLPADVSKSIDEHGLVAVSVLSGNRNFEGRVNVDVRANYLMRPPLVVAYALAGRIGHNFETDALGVDGAGKPVYLKDIWPTQAEVAAAIEKGLSSESFRKEYATVSMGDANWQGLKFPTGEVYQWE